MDDSLFNFGPEDALGFDDSFSPSPFDPAEYYPMDDNFQSQENEGGNETEESKNGI